MKPLFPAFLSTAALCAFIVATPALAQETVTGAPAGTAPVTVQGYTYQGYGWPGYGPGYGYGYAPGYGAPWAPAGPVAAGVGAVGAGVVGAANIVGAGATGAVTVPAYAVRPSPGCTLYHDWNGRYTSVCGP